MPLDPQTSSKIPCSQPDVDQHLHTAYSPTWLQGYRSVQKLSKVVSKRVKGKDRNNAFYAIVKAMYS